MTVNQLMEVGSQYLARGANNQVKSSGYRQTELGLIPSDWDVEKIGNVVSISTGAKNTQDKEPDGQYPFFVRSQQVERINSYSFDGEAVLTAGDGVGTGKIFHYINGKFDFHQRVYLMHKFGEKLDGYFFYIFFSNHFYNRIMAMTAKSSVDSVRREMIFDMPIAVPPIKEQTAIANALSDVDALIQELEKLIAKKQAIKTATMQQLLTGRTRLPRFAYNADGSKKGYKQSELGEMPEDWFCQPLGEICELTSSKRIFESDYVRDGIPFYRGQEVSLLIQGKSLDSNIYIDEQKFESIKAKYGVPQQGDILITAVGTLANALLVKNSNSFYFKDGNLIWARKFTNIEPEFLFSLLDLNKARVLDTAIGSSQKALTMESLKPLVLTFPILKKEQTAIATILSDMVDEIQALEQRLSKTRQIKQGMMQELLTGRTRLVTPEAS